MLEGFLAAANQTTDPKLAKAYAGTGILLGGILAIKEKKAEKKAAKILKGTMDKITTSLNLDTAQLSRTDSVFADYYSMQRKIIQDAKDSGNRPDSSSLEKITVDRDEKLKVIFTEGQYSLFKNEVEDSLEP